MNHTSLLELLHREDMAKEFAYPNPETKDTVKLEGASSTVGRRGGLHSVDGVGTLSRQSEAMSNTLHTVTEKLQAFTGAVKKSASTLVHLSGPARPSKPYSLYDVKGYISNQASTCFEQSYFLNMARCLGA